MPFVPSPDHGGWSQVVHGGIVATVLDEVMTWAAIIASHRPCFAADFGVRLLRPLAPGAACVVAGRVAADRRRILDVESWLKGEDGVEYARGSGRYVPLPAEQIAAFRQDFVVRQGAVTMEELLAPRASAPKAADEEA